MLIPKSFSRSAMCKNASIEAFSIGKIAMGGNVKVFPLNFHRVFQ
jgi:hypothetical protein